MPGIARYKIDAAQGKLQKPAATTVFADGHPVALIGSKVAGHGESPHSGPTLIDNGSISVRVDGEIPAKQGTTASCGHTVGPGSSTVIVD